TFTRLAHSAAQTPHASEAALDQLTTLQVSRQARRPGIVCAGAGDIERAHAALKHLRIAHSDMPLASSIAALSPQTHAGKLVPLGAAFYADLRDRVRDASGSVVLGFALVDIVDTLPYLGTDMGPAADGAARG
ncbi:unnamed protein product, partial [Prorocentrum cordatum]